MNIDLVSIGELKGMSFTIPTYQRGYRWTDIEVKDLLDDIDEFIGQDGGKIYCLQPLVVRMGDGNGLLEDIRKADSVAKVKKLLKDDAEWEVIDGQQRLTTVYILLVFLLENGTDFYKIKYETRSDSQAFLKNISDKEAGKNIDFNHIYNARKTIQEWFDGKDESYKHEFTAVLMDKVKFIWYETDEDNPISVFTRLNIGKISLTNAELIKALLFSSSNFDITDEYAVRLRQQEIALQWENLENTLGNDEFWLFLHSPKENYDTRIDWIFNLICDNDRLDIKASDQEIGEKGRDRYRTFRYFNKAFKSFGRKETMRKTWNEVMFVFNTVSQWYGDVELYHYTGFLVETCGDRIQKEMFEEWKHAGSRNVFLNSYVVPQISKKVNNCLDADKKLDTQYEVSGRDKTRCKPLLLLFNIQTIIDENKAYMTDEKYQMGVFHKFPFHLYKSEAWDIEHIDSCTQNSLDNENDRKEFLACSLIDTTDEGLRHEIIDYLSAKESARNTQNDTFATLYDKITRSELSDDNRLNDSEKDRIWNFALLDQGTNRSYKNALFASKRRTIIDKCQATHTYVWSKEKLEREEKDVKAVFITKEIRFGDNVQYEVTFSGVQAFVPECTLRCFLKYYNRSSSNLREWTRDDAIAYKNEIERTLEKFLN